MATGKDKEHECSLVNVEPLKLVYCSKANFDPDFSDIVVSGDKIIVADSNECNVQVYSHHDGHFLFASHKLESEPLGICLVNDMELCVLLNNSTIQIMLVQCTRDKSCIRPFRSFHIKHVFHKLHGMAKLMNKVLAFGEKEGTHCFCIVSLNDGHTEHIREICKGYQVSTGYSYTHVDTRDNMIYISLYSGSGSPNVGVYAYDIHNPAQHKFVYKHNDLKNPSSITVDRWGFVFVCNNHPVLPPCIHHLTSECKLVTIYSSGIPWNLKDIFCDQQSGHLYITSRMSNTITRYKPVYSYHKGEVGGRQASSLISRLKNMLGVNRPHKKNADKHRQGDSKVPESLVNDGRQQPASEQTSAEIEQELLSSDYIHPIRMERTQTHLEKIEKGHSKDKIKMHPSVRVSADCECDEQAHTVPKVMVNAVRKLKFDERSTQTEHGDVEFRVKSDSVLQRSRDRHAIYIETSRSLIGKVDSVQSSLEIESTPSEQVSKDSEDDKRGEVGGRQASSLISRLKNMLGVNRPHKKNADKHRQGDSKVPESLVNDGRQQPASEQTSAEIEQELVEFRVKSDSFLQRSRDRHAIYIETSRSLIGKVDSVQSSLEIESTPSEQVSKDSEDDKRATAIPVEILRMDDKSIQLFKEALRDGKEKVYNIRVMVVGPYGVGKTSLTKRLLGHQFDILDRKSTEGIDIYKHSCKIYVDTGEWIEQNEDAEQLSRLQRLLKLLTDQAQRPDDSGQQKDHAQVIYQADTNPICRPSPVYYNVSDTDADISPRGELIFQNDSSNSEESDNNVEEHTYANQPNKSYFVKVDQKKQLLKSFDYFIQESGKQETTTGDATMEFFQLAVKQADKLTKSILDYATLAMWDFAGQYVFYTTHQTFLSCRAIYLLVTDLSQQITDLVKDDECYFDTEGVKLCKVQDLLEVWFNSIHSCAPSSSAVAGVTDSDVSIPVTPPVILVGTHADQISEDKRHEVIKKYFQQICYSLKDKPCLQHLSGFFAIDNTQCDPQLESLKKQILLMASKQPYWGEELPANWLPLEDALRKLKSAGKKVIPIRVIEEVNKAAAVPIKTAEQLDLFLRFQHQTGNILFFGVEGLREWVIIDPNWLIDALKSLITAESFVLNNNPAVITKWFEFKENGKLTTELIDAIWTNDTYPDFHCNKDIILQFMEKLNIVARPRLYIQDTEILNVEDYFLAPCMLRQATPEDLIILKQKSQQRITSVLSFVFTEKFLPPPVFHRLLAACVAQWPIAKHKLENLIFCGCCVFNIDIHHRLTILFREHAIFAGVTIMGITDTAPSSKVCIRIKEFITMTLFNIIGCLGQNLRFELCIQCPESKKYNADCLISVAILKANAIVPCQFHDSNHIIMSKDVLKFWFQEEEHSEGEYSAFPMPTPPAGDTDRFMRLTYLLVDVGSRILRQLLNHHTVTPTCTFDQFLAQNRKTIDSLHKRKVLHQSQMDILFPPNGSNTNLEDYDVTLLSALFNNIVPSLTQQEEGMIQSLREDRNKLYGHAKSCKINAIEYQTCWTSISSTLITLSQQCGDPNFQNEIMQEIQQTQVSSIPTGSYLDILKTWFSTIETVKESLGTTDGELQALKSRVEALELKKAYEESEEK